MAPLMCPAGTTEAPEDVTGVRAPPDQVVEARPGPEAVRVFNDLATKCLVLPCVVTGRHCERGQSCAVWVWPLPPTH